MNDIFERMTREELDSYAKDGSLPLWFVKAVGATKSNSQEGKIVKNQGDKIPLSATDSMPGPGGFPLGSTESRAAARRRVQLLLESRVKNTVLILGLEL